MADITFFRHHRKVDHKDGSSEYKVAPLKKSIYSLTDLDELMAAWLSQRPSLQAPG